MQPTISADVESIGTYFAQPLVAPVQVVTKLEDADDVDTQGAVRIESAAESPIVEIRGAAWDLSFLVHGYSTDEIEAGELCRKVIAHAAAARGTTVMGWYIVDVISVIGGVKLPEPGVEGLTRYRGAVTWRVSATPL